MYLRKPERGEDAATSSAGISRACLLSLAELKAGPVWVHECAAANLSLKPSPFVEPRVMDGISGAASIIAVVDISAKIASLCFQYSVAVKNAKEDIKRL